MIFYPEGPKIIEAGHFYSQQWVSREATKWWWIWEWMKRDWDMSMLLIDDIHMSDPHISWDTDICPVNILMPQGQISDGAGDIIAGVNKNSNVTVDAPATIWKPDKIILESEMRPYSEQIVDILSWLSRKKKARFREWHGTFCSDKKILDADWNPTCIWYDLWLTLLKEELWFNNILNILPEGYWTQQNAVNRIYSKINPEINIKQHYF